MNPASFLRYLQMFGIGQGGGGGSTTPQLQMIQVSTRAAAGGDGSIGKPFQTRSEALAAVAASATVLAPFVLKFDPGAYSDTDFAIFPNVYDYVEVPGSVQMTVGSGLITADPSWDSNSAAYVMSGLTFDPATALAIDFSALSGVTGAIALTNNNLTAAGAINGFGNTIDFVAEGNTFPGGITLTGLRTVNADKGNDFDSIDIESGISSVHCSASFNNNKNVGDVTIHTQGSADISATFNNSPASSYTYEQESKSSIELSLDSSSWRSPSSSGGTASVTRTTEAASVNVNHTPANYTPNPSNDPSVEAAIAGIDDALGGLGGNTVNFSAYQSVQQSIAHNTLTAVNFQSKNFDTGGYFDVATGKYTPLVTGAFLGIFQGAWSAPGSANTTVQFFVYKNGSGGTLVAQTTPMVVALGTIINIPPIVFEVEMNGTTDYLQVYCKQVQASGSASLNLNNTPTAMYFTGALLNQKASAVTPATVTNTICVAKNGSDIDGDGTIDFPFLSIVAATNFIVALASYSPTNQYDILIDDGSYAETGLKVYPNINLKGTGRDKVIINNNTDITLHSSWHGAAFAVHTMSDLTIGNSTILNLDSSAITVFTGNIYFQNVVTTLSPTFKNSATGAYNVYLLGGVVFDTTNSTPSIFDGINLYDLGGNSISKDGTTSFITTNNAVTVYQVGSAGMGSPSLITSGLTSHTIFFESYAGKQINFAAVTAGVNNSISIYRDATTWKPGTTYSGAFASSIIDINVSLPNGASLNYGATTNWDARSNFAASLELTGDTLMANPTGLIGPQDYSLDVIMDATGGRSITSWGANFQFPNGIPSLNTAANAVTPFLFHSPDGILMICRSPAGYKAPNTVTTNLATGTTLTANTVNNVTDAASHSWPLPASPKVGDIVKARVNGAGGQFTLSLNAGQSGVFGNAAVTASITSTYRGAVQAGNALTAECMVGGASAQWFFIPEQGSYDWV